MSANHRSGRDHTVIDILDGSEKSTNCIFRVPNVLWRQNPKAYTPDVVSIGPFHHHLEKRGKKEGQGGKKGNGEKYFQLMERVKTRYLNEILAGMQNMTMEELTAKVIELSDQKNEGGFEQRARNFYAEPLHFSSEEFIKMMIVDGCFLIQLFRKCDDPKLRALYDPVFNMDCMFHFLCHDILLLENQLPWFVIHILYDLTHDIYPNQPSLSFRVLKAFSMLPSLRQGCSSYSKHLRQNNCHLHILDLIRSSIVVPLRTSNPEEHEVDSGNKHKGNNEVVHEAIIDPDLHQIRTATELSKSDIKFKMAKKESIMDIRFKKGTWFRNGILEIPQLNVGMSSETLFRNLIAIEQCYHGYSNEITSYAIFMDNLISSKEDMELLCKKKVIGNLMSDEDGCKFFSNLYKDIPHNKFYYVELCKEVNDRYNMRWYTWLALLKFEKFSNPWKVLAFVVAIIALTLTAWSQTNLIRINWHK
ncbi:hypothetical protein RchiOBHm_Chr4g0390801 [Rosa chinensis]|uniref:Uncharacterized protein n=1 Tax=Rosa chinensis TaxID=74649 RepID=A0A2P6QQA6_ROSCH|nr:UPF0481 protein At3g47200 [Rosa chinensis]XP_024192267.1 UPF0481 protein At3g47200 [Rosa chinensis]PRQ36374.1 hypothetical protein RchiOBHm_Chr4g0390801 [Rosa chinensis]